MAKYYIYNIDELYHHGVLGMRWGIRRYQPYSTTGGRKSGASGKEVGLAKSRGKSSSNKKKPSIGKILKNVVRTTEKGIKKTVDVGKKSYKTGKKIYDNHNEHEKRKIINSGNAKKVYENRRKLSTKELNEAINRIDTERKIKELKKSRFRKFAEDGASKSRDVLLESGSSLAKAAIIGYGSYSIKKQFKEFKGEELSSEFVNPMKKKK